MANNLINNSIITREALMIRRNSNDLIKNISREYQGQFAQRGAKIGDTINVRLPNDYVVQDGPVVNPEATAERSIPLTINFRKNVPMSFSTQERTLNIDDFSERYIAPAVNALVGQVASDAMTLALQASNMVVNTDDQGNLIAPSSQTWLNAKALLTSCNAPLDDRFAVLDPMTDANTVSGMMGSKILGVREWMQDQTVMISQTGSYDGSATATGTYGNYTPNGAPVTTISSSASPHSSVFSTSAISGTLKAGDIITIAGVNRINRVNKNSLYLPQQFVVLADCASGATSIPLSPAIIPPGANGPVPYQTVDAAPASGATIKLVAPAGSIIRRNMLYSKRALTLATVDLENVSELGPLCARASLDGVSLRTVTYYNGTDDTRSTGLDVLYGIGMLRPDWCVIVPELVQA
ncbi:P22 phage major capsid protein family protein [Gluconobacter cerinus]|uniref:P22 phage major capsid protein family protein n=1 Tax=Gluconobacter cerinus TaxID=38307 RepID=UPI003AB7F547